MKFSDLEYGEKFTYENEVYVKLPPIDTDDTKFRNADCVKLSTGDFCEMHHNAQVVVIKKFKDLKPGQQFNYANDRWMKTTTVTNRDGNDYNVVSLTSGFHSFVSDEYELRF